MDRQQWIFPEPRDGLDPSRKEDRGLLVLAEHPHTPAAIDAGREGDPEGGAANARVHLTLHQVVADQIWDDDPPEVWQAASRLAAAGFDRHEVLHMLAAAGATPILGSLNDGVPFDREAYQRALDALPRSWLVAKGNPGDAASRHRIVGATLDILTGRGPLTLEELARSLDIEEKSLGWLENYYSVSRLADGRLASVTALLCDTILTHRLSSKEAEAEHLGLTVDVAPLISAVCDDDHIHLPGGEIATFEGWIEQDVTKPALSGDTLVKAQPGWLGGAGAGDLVGLRLVATEATRRGELGFATMVQVGPADHPGPILDTFSAQLQASFERFNGGAGVPVPVAQLLNQLAADAPGLVKGALPPISELLAVAGFELAEGHTAPAGTDWDGFRRLMRVARTADLHGLEYPERSALHKACELCIDHDQDGGEVPRDVARLLGETLGSPTLGKAFAEALEDRAEATMGFLSRARWAAGQRYAADLAWVEALVASRCGALARAEACLALGIAADASHPGLLEDLAWYACDRGDARQALGYLVRIGTEGGDTKRMNLLRGYAGTGPSRPLQARNDRCICGSGRKYKQCCLKIASDASLPPLIERTTWLWEKLVWWLERMGPDNGVLHAALLLRVGAEDPLRAEGLLADMDFAASLVLFEDRAIDEFIRQRACLLPADEAALLARWASTRGGAYEVVGVTPGKALDLRSSGDTETIEVGWPSGSAVPHPGQWVFAHPTSDGAAFQPVGGVMLIASEGADLAGRFAQASTSRDIANLIGSLRYQVGA